ncbi:MAG: hypothetical protein JKY51_06110, partial [Opitutaceae bacterium]|nr:hypothetical protein [Opitutaceae bacterium]
FMSLLSERTLYERGSRFGSDIFSDEEKSVVQENIEKLDAGLGSLLGEEDFAVYQQYEKTLPQRRSVDNLTQKLSYSGTPLGEEVAEKLISIMASQEGAFVFTNDLSNGGPRSLNQSSPEEVETYLNERGVLNTQIFNQAQEILNEDQLDTFLEQQLEEIERIQRWSEMSSQRRG